MLCAGTRPPESCLSVAAAEEGLPPRPGLPAASVKVHATIRLRGNAEWVTVGVGDIRTDPSGRQVLCIRLEAVPANRRLYIPLQDVLVLAHEPGGAESAPPPGEGTGRDLRGSGREGHA